MGWDSYADRLRIRASRLSQNWTFIAAGTGATGANPSPGVPAGTQSGDLLILIAGSNATAFTNLPTGYTKAEGAASNDFCGNLTVWWKAAGGSESAPSITNADTTCAANLLCYRNVITTAVDATGTKATGGSGTASAGSVTTTAADDLVVHLYACAAAASTWTNPSGTTNRLNVSAASTHSGLLVCDEDQPTAGATTARTGQISVSQGIGGVTVAWQQTAPSTQNIPTQIYALVV